jgi:phage tail-like protein
MTMTVADSEKRQRGLVPGLTSSAPLNSALPAVLQEDAFCARMSLAFDESFAPILSTLDCLTSYFDPDLAPPDFLQWLAGWVGLDIDETWPVARRRLLVAEAIELHRIRGTREGLRRLVALYAGIPPDVEESGACAWSQTAGTPLPGSEQSNLVVRLDLPSGGWVVPAVVERIVRSARPAHVPQYVEIRVGTKQVHPPTSSELEDGTDLDMFRRAENVPQAQTPSDDSVEVGPGVPEISDDDTGTAPTDEPELDP